MGLFPAADEIAFWGRQLAEHAVFLDLGLTDPGLKPQAHALAVQWAKNLADPGWRTNPARVIADVDALVAFKTAALGAQRSAFIGWLFPLFIDHMRREAIYFRQTLTGPAIDPGADLCTWIQFMREHAEFAAHLLDPTERAKIDAAQGVADGMAQTLGGCAHDTLDALIALSRMQGAALDAYLTAEITPQTASVIHPALAAHIVREGRRFLATIDAIARATGSAA